jgi:hypothetical protein
VVNLVNHAVRGTRVVLADVGRDFVDIVERFRVQLLTDQAGPLRRASILSCNRAKASSPGISLTLPLLTSS